MIREEESLSVGETRQWWVRFGFWALFFLSVAGLFRVHGWEREQDVNRYLPGQYKKTWSEFQSINRDFGFGRGLLIGLETPKGQDVFSRNMLKLIRQSTNRLKAMPGIQNVVSLANSPSISKKGDAMVVQPLLPRSFENFRIADQKKIRRIALKDPLLRGSLVSANGRATWVIAFLKPANKSKTTHRETINKVLGLLKELGPIAPQARFGLVGEPFVGPLLVKHLRPQTLTVFGLFVLWILLMFFLFIPGWRRKGWFLGVGVIVLFLGLSSHMGWSGGLHGSIHLIPLWIWWIVGLWAMYFTPLTNDSPSPSWLWMGTVMLLLWSIALAFYPWPMLQRWGMTTAFTLLAVIAVVRFFSPPTIATATVQRKPIAWSTLTTGTSTLLILAIGAGIAWLPTGISSTQHVYPQHGLLAHGDRISHEHFGGAVPFFIRYQGDLQDPVQLKSMERVGRRLSLLPGVSPVQSYGVIVRRLHTMLNQIPRIPDSRLKDQLSCHIARGTGRSRKPGTKEKQRWHHPGPHSNHKSLETTTTAASLPTRFA